MSKQLRISYFHKKAKDLSRVLTGAYTIDFMTGEVCLSAVVYQRTEPGEQWDRKMQNKYALERMLASPIKLNFGKPVDHPLHYYNHRRLERILHRCITEHGVQYPRRVYPKDKSVCLPTTRLVADQLNFQTKVPRAELDPNPENPTIHDYSQLWDSVFNSELTANEKQSYQRHLDLLYKRGKPIYQVDYCPSTKKQCNGLTSSDPSMQFPMFTNECLFLLLHIFAMLLIMNQISWSMQVNDLTNRVDKLIDFLEPN